MIALQRLYLFVFFPAGQKEEGDKDYFIQSCPWRVGTDMEGTGSPLRTPQNGQDTPGGHAGTTILTPDHSCGVVTTHLNSGCQYMAVMATPHEL